MELRVFLTSLLQILFTLVVSQGSPLSSSSSLSSPSSSSSVSFSVSSESPNCQPMENGICSHLYNSVQLPNLYGDFSQKEVTEKLKNMLGVVSDQSIHTVLTFFCTLYLPPCLQKVSPEVDVMKSQTTTLPCRHMCELAMEEGRELVTISDSAWPIKCHVLPTENCFNFDGPKSVTFVKRSIKATPLRSLNDDVISFAPLEVELGNDEGYEVEVVSMSEKPIPERRYDITDLGDHSLFHGWADVQGTGAANDYCRVVGKGKRRFLSCNLAGSTGQGHHYVSKLGFEAGHPDTWFMRDMDSDGRDDYCRCVGTKSNSKMTCMKAGDKGFYGSTTQGGNQHTFSLPASEGCYGKRFNAMFGEKYS